MNAAWFYPYLKRLADGESVSLAEIQNAYREQFRADMQFQRLRDF